MTSTETLPVRQITQLHARWQDNGDGVPGTFQLSVLLDDGAQEVVAVADVRDIQALLPLLTGGAESAVLDLERGALVIGGVGLPIRRRT